ncbi:hypothetical protein ACGF4C_34990 [Streptomyces sp. NPDC048197]|uniref:hypothetical protein n=1 Tax=Streptomyces sp. NPDC048197 TaxID=3365511 RepID=UPI0037106613
MTAVVFAAGTGLCGALLLPVMQDPAVRWTVACGAGAALAALAAMWGYGYAGSAGATPGPGGQPTVRASGARAVAIHGSNTGAVTTGDVHLPSGPRPSDLRPPGHSTPSSQGTPGAAPTASGERAIAIGGDNDGPLSTGDSRNETPR